MPAKPKRGTVPSLDGDGVDKRITFVKRKFHFRTISRTAPAQRPHRKKTRAITTFARSRTFPHIRTLRAQMDTPIYYEKILNKKIPRV